MLFLWTDKQISSDNTKKMIFQLFIVAYILYSDVSYYKDLDLACVSNTAVIIPTCQFTEYFYVIKNAFGIQIQAQSKFVAFTVH